jgi:hypothetical protein
MTFYQQSNLFLSIPHINHINYHFEPLVYFIIFEYIYFKIFTFIYLSDLLLFQCNITDF